MNAEPESAAGSESRARPEADTQPEAAARPDAESEDRTIALFGATGRTGSWIAVKALRRGFEVNALRRPASFDPVAAKPITMLEGDVQNVDHVSRVIEGTSAVLVALGQRRPYGDVFCEAATAAILESMRRHAVMRIVAVTGAMIGELDQGQTGSMRYLARLFRNEQPAAAADRAGQERLIMESDRAWTIVKPPRLTPGMRRPRIKIGTHMRIGVLSRISRENVADLMLDQIDSDEYIGQRVLVKA